MSALTKAQREVLAWLVSLDNGATDISDKRVVNTLINKGLAFYSISDDAWFATDAGRAVIRAGRT